MESDVTMALLHFAPVEETVVGEPREIYWGLGCRDLGDVIDNAGADLVVHGHGHAGTELGQTLGCGRFAMLHIQFCVGPTASTS